MAKVWQVLNCPEQIDAEDLAKYGLMSAGMSRGYVMVMCGGKQVPLHNLILSVPTGMIGDHINGVRNDNRKANLRICNRLENNRNTSHRSHSTYNYKGVEKKGRNWYAHITVNGKKINSVKLPNEISAARMYNKLALQYFGEYARLNVIGD